MYTIGASTFILRKAVNFHNFSVDVYLLVDSLPYCFFNHVPQCTLVCAHRSHNEPHKWVSHFYFFFIWKSKYLSRRAPGVAGDKIVIASKSIIFNWNSWFRTSLLQRWHFRQCSARDERASSLRSRARPLPNGHQIHLQVRLTNWNYSWNIAFSLFFRIFLTISVYKISLFQCARWSSKGSDHDHLEWQHNDCDWPRWNKRIRESHLPK